LGRVFAHDGIALGVDKVAGLEPTPFRYLRPYPLLMHGHPPKDVDRGSIAHIRHLPSRACFRVRLRDRRHPRTGLAGAPGATAVDRRRTDSARTSSGARGPIPECITPEKGGDVISRPSFKSPRRTAGDALDRVGNDRRMALPRVGVQLHQRGGLPRGLAVPHQASLQLFVGEVNVSHRPAKNAREHLCDFRESERGRTGHQVSAAVMPASVSSESIGIPPHLSLPPFETRR
jgi:hypothetical protein